MKIGLASLIVSGTLTALKLTDNIDLSWGAVLTPILMYFVFATILMIFIVNIALTDMYRNKDS